jgi:hypothetical protein
MNGTGHQLGNLDNGIGRGQIKTDTVREVLDGSYEGGLLIKPKRVQ